MKHRYKITVDGTDVREYYEFDQYFTEEDVREIWLNDVSDRWGDGVAGAFRGKVNVKQLTDDDEPPALP